MGTGTARSRRLRQPNVRNLSLQWIHSVRGFDNEMTPLVLDGIMYITATNQVSAIDAATGREIWRFSRPRSTGASRRRRDRFQSRRRGARLACVSRHRQRASACGEPRERRAALGSRAAGKHAAALRRHHGAARRRRSRHRRRVGRRRRHSRIPRRLSRRHRRAGVALLDRSRARRARHPTPGRATSISKRAAAPRG